MVDSSGDLKVYVPATNIWLNVSDNLFSNNTQSIVYTHYIKHWLILQ